MNPLVAKKFDEYPEAARAQLILVRAAVLSVAEGEDIGAVTETLKWGEPSYLCAGGSPIRMAWKSRAPDHFSLYFNCKTSLIDTFKELYPDAFSFVGNREIVFSVSQPIPLAALKACISMALRYHGIKHLALLGA